MMTDTRITPFQPPVISSRNPAGAKIPDEAAAEAVSRPAKPAAEKQAAANTATMNPLAALFGQREAPTPSGAKINQSAADPPIRGRFVDVMA
jgi:hypothetical protein